MQRLVWSNGKFVRSPSEFNKTALVTYADGRYAHVPAKLIRTVEEHNPGLATFVFRSPEEIGSPPHSENPYAFKVYAIQKVRSMGYTTILWCDSCLRAVKSLVPLIERIKAVGMYFQKDGWVSGQWSNDKALAYFGLSRDEAMHIRSVYACFMGFNFESAIANEFFVRWKRACQMGMFIGRWKNDERTESDDVRCTGHRHDQTCAELIAHQLNIPLQKHVLSNNVHDADRFFTSWDKP